MTRGLHCLRRVAVIRCSWGHVFLSGRVLDKSIRNSRNKLKANRDSIASSSIGFSSSGRLNPNPNFSRAVVMSETKYTIGDKPYQVEYLETPVKSETDKKEYRVIKLQNGLIALLISDVHSKTSSYQNDDDQDEDASTNEDDDYESDEDDEEEDSDNTEGKDEKNASNEFDGESTSSVKRVKRDEKKAACGLCVGVGSFSDPLEIPGMAHFLEHMVFMGSEKYPEENDFDAYLSKRGGFSNAKTDCEHTTFYFDIQDKHLLPSLDHFAQFFVKPLMRKDAIARERESVESEFQLSLPYDENRKEQLLASFAQTNHPASKFTWGNLQTLRDNIDDDKLYEELHKFRERHYNAHRMRLTIQARLPLDTLEEYVASCFSNVPSNELPPDDFTEFKDGVSFDTPAFRRMYKIKPVENINLVEITWVMSSQLSFYKTRPIQYIASIIEYGGKGSLISYLRKKMWATDIFTNNDDTGFEQSSMYSLFKVAVVLTDEGRKHLDEVLDAIFSFVNLVKTKGPQERIYDEIQKIAENLFRFANEEDPADYVEQLCLDMHFFSPRDYITGSELYLEYNPEIIQNCLDYLVPEKANIMILDGDTKCLKLDKVEPWFKTEYRDDEISRESIERWKTIEPLTDFNLPLPNAFLTSDFSLISLPPDVPKYPVKIHSDSTSEIWYRPDPKFRLPECFINFQFISHLGFQSPENAALVTVYCNVLKLLLVEELYPATTAGFEYEIGPSERGVAIKMNGFNEKLPLLLLIIVKYMADYSNLATKELFEVVKEQQLKAYYNTFIKPKHLVRDVRMSILKLIHYTYVEKHNALLNINFEEFQDFVKSFTKHLYVQCLVQGNITQDAVMENVQQCMKIINCEPLLPQTVCETKVMQMPLGTRYCKLKSMNKNDVNSVVTNYYQLGDASIELRVLIDLFVVMIEEPLFNQLRTKEQLGYDVECVFSVISGILGYTIMVRTQADKYTTEHVDERIEEFLKMFQKILKKMPIEEFNDFKEALRKEKQESDIDLREEVDRNWSEIVGCYYVFDRLEREALAVQNVKINEMREWCTKHTQNGSNLRKLSVHVTGIIAKKNKSDETINNVEDSRKVQYSLEYTNQTNNQQNKKTKRQDNYITNVADYKKKLIVYETRGSNFLPMKNE